MENEAKGNESLAAARVEQQRIAAAYAEVFGQGAGRSAAQRLVLDHLFRDANDDRNAFQFESGRDGVGVALAAAHRDGAASRKRIVDRQLQIAAESKQPIKSAPKVRR